MITNFEKFDKSREEVISFFRDYIEILSDAIYDAKQNETEGKGLKMKLGKLFILYISLNE